MRVGKGLPVGQLKLVGKVGGEGSTEAEAETKLVFWGVLRLLFKNCFKSLNHEKLCKFPNDGRFRKAKPLQKREERKRREGQEERRAREGEEGNT